MIAMGLRIGRHIKEGLKRDKRKGVRPPRGGGLCHLDVAREHNKKGNMKGRGDEGGKECDWDAYVVFASPCVVA